MKYEVRFSNRFKKDLKTVKKQGKNVDLLFEVIGALANGEPLAEKYCDHELTGNFEGCRECHIRPDWLLIYQIRDEELILYLTRTGSHSDLFK